ncbi:uncharacterized protein MEPE_05809 [Melanopsichium pennsylvanicum]|uniref:DUF1014-domain-containing protein n=2 Tax=Melanopsichium pennsylvanicum TaxID=63383 RepID=A0AAJ4XQ56_9BASI|nr:conserved hypothetical protein [Melanopsichium pennsylvanicum 4]SNX87099.1 uncharacterized protein MEPE_05809 [Melanopsichium pennsylvanicum]
MPAKGGNAKKESGRAKKAANEDKKAVEAAARAESEEAARWDDPTGGKGKSAAEKKAEKAAEAARKAEEKKRLQDEDEASLPSAPVKSANKGKGAPKKSALKSGGATGIDQAITSFSASNLDDALDAMSLVNERTDKAGQGSAAAAIERHPERRFKAAFEAYKERELPIIKQEHKGLRLQQYHDLLYKQFQKHPDNPFNQLSLAYDASKEEKMAALEAKRSQTEKRLRD